MPTQPSSVVPTADFGTRFSAFMIDAAVLFAAQWMIFIVLSRQFQAVGFTTLEPCSSDAARMCEGPSTVLWVILLLVLLVSTVAYHAAFEGLYGATPGKRWMNLAVVNDANEMPIGLSSGAIRALVRQAFWLSLFFVLDVSPFDLSLPAVLFVLLPLAGLVMLALGAVRADGLSMHDLAAGTRVVRVAEAQPDQRRPAPTESEADEEPAIAAVMAADASAYVASFDSAGSAVDDEAADTDTEQESQESEERHD